MDKVRKLSNWHCQNRNNQIWLNTFSKLFLGGWGLSHKTTWYVSFHIHCWYPPPCTSTPLHAITNVNVAELRHSCVKFVLLLPDVQCKLNLYSNVKHYILSDENFLRNRHSLNILWTRRFITVFTRARAESQMNLVHTTSVSYNLLNIKQSVRKTCSEYLHQSSRPYLDRQMWV
jgi:hypothetical protein